MDAVKTAKIVKTIVQFALGLICGYLLIMAYQMYQENRVISIQSDGKTPVLETVVGY